MVRRLAIGLVLLTTAAPGTESQSVAPSEPIVHLVRAEPLVNDISVSVIWTRPLNLLMVQVHKGDSEVSEIGGHLPKEALDLAIQTWILKSDGTALSRRPGEFPGVGRPRARPTAWTVYWAFEHAQTTELTAVVVRVGGALFVRPTPRNATTR